MLCDWGLKCHINPRRIFPFTCFCSLRSLSSGLSNTNHQHLSRQMQDKNQSYFLSDTIATLLEGEDGDEGVEAVEDGGEGLWGPKALGTLGM